MEEKEFAEIEELINDEQTPKRKPTVRRKALSRARASISKDPIIYAETVQDLVEKASPMKRKALQENLPTIATPMEKRKVDALIANNVKRKLNHLKYSRNSNQRMQRRQFASSLIFEEV
ncbi:hypothetical protein HOLleu_10381 [Holothuria leucospilota]|uniref:Uncharacterized protein n=1 Tax=Holothuria leucospilota TaxID=206669 RepID=A0A9Q1CDK3_HOLLE|nr:hypothetical protein HOLleu_10381 [Holothuria leucospilota]